MEQLFVVEDCSRSRDRAQHPVQVTSSKSGILGPNETIDRLAMRNSVYWCGNAVRRALEYEEESQSSNLTTNKLRWMWQPSLVGETTALKTLVSLSLLNIRPSRHVSSDCTNQRTMHTNITQQHG